MHARATMRTAAELAGAGLVPPQRVAALERVAARYAVAVTPAMTDLIEAGDSLDPIAAQFIPDARELETGPDESADPIGDHAHAPVEGIVHRYPDRVLLKLVNICPVYCRFCFRREMVGPGRPATLAPQALAATLSYIRGDPAIWEVILSGGDPLIVSPRRLRRVMRELADIDHVKVIRFHTRVPVAAPERITSALLDALAVEGKATYVVLHANHPRELTREARAACGRIVDAGIPMLSQSVLLKGVNDDAQTLGALMRAFVETRIKPYYLHHLDAAPGTERFRCTIEHGQSLMRSLRGHASGLCQPTYVLDIPGGHGKSPIGPNYLTAAGAANDPHWEIADYRGQQHHIAPPKQDNG